MILSLDVHLVTRMAEIISCIRVRAMVTSQITENSPNAAWITWALLCRPLRRITNSALKVSKFGKVYTLEKSFFFQFKEISVRFVVTWLLMKAKSVTVASITTAGNRAVMMLRKASWAVVLSRMQLAGNKLKNKLKKRSFYNLINILLKVQAKARVVTMNANYTLQKSSMSA